MYNIVFEKPPWGMLCMYVRDIKSPEEREHHVSFKQGLAQGPRLP